MTDPTDDRATACPHAGKRSSMGRHDGNRCDDCYEFIRHATADRPPAGETHEFVSGSHKYIGDGISGCEVRCPCCAKACNRHKHSHPKQLPATRPAATEAGPCPRCLYSPCTAWCRADTAEAALAASQAQAGELGEAFQRAVDGGIQATMNWRSAESESARLRAEVEGLRAQVKTLTEAQARAMRMLSTYRENLRFLCSPEEADRAAQRLQAVIDLRARADKAEAQLADAREELERYKAEYLRALDAATPIFQDGGRYGNLLRLGDSITSEGPTALAEYCDSLQAQLAAVQGELAVARAAGNLKGRCLLEAEAQVASLQADKAAAMVVIEYERRVAQRLLTNNETFKSYLDAKRRLGL